MPFEPDPFDDIIETEVEEVAPGMLGAIRDSLSATFDVGDVTVRTALQSGDFATIRWAAECTDAIREDRRRTDRGLTIHGLSLVGSRGDERFVTHYIDWAGAMAQLGMTTSRPSAVDVPAERNSPA